MTRGRGTDLRCEESRGDGRFEEEDMIPPSERVMQAQKDVVIHVLYGDATRQARCHVQSRLRCGYDSRV